MSSIHWNPLSVVDHNQHRWPRIAFHAVHVALGVPLALAGDVFHLPGIVLLAAAFVVQSLAKCIWIDWRRTSGRLLHWTGLHEHEPFDYASDVLLTMLGALVLVALPAHALGWGIAYYCCSTFNGT